MKQEVIPSWLPREEWEGFRPMRKKIKKEMTPRAEQMAMKKLQWLMDQGEEAALALAQSEYYNWQDLYAVKPEFYQMMKDVEPQSAAVLQFTSRKWAN
jgi:hypothetical protein